MIEQNEFYEYNVHHNHFYGTSKKALNDKINEGKIIVKDIDVNGTENLKKLLEKDINCFIEFKTNPENIKFEKTLINDVSNVQESYSQNVFIIFKSFNEIYLYK